MKKTSKSIYKNHSIRVTCFLLILFAMTNLAGCSKEKDTNTDDMFGVYRIYYINKDNTGLSYETFHSDVSDTSILLDELLKRLETDSEKYGYKKALGENIVVKDYNVNDDKLVLNFDSNYSGQSKINEVLTRAAIVMTLTQIPEIEDVEFTIGGQPLMDSYEKPVGLMSASDFIDSTEVKKDYIPLDVTIYYANKAGDKLVGVNEPAQYDGATTMEQLILKCLMEGPGKDEKGLQPVIPEGTVLNSVSTIEGVCYVDFSSEFIDNKISTITDDVAIYAVVNSLVELSSINKVKFMIDGAERATFRENEPFDTLFIRDLDIIEGSK